LPFGAIQRFETAIIEERGCKHLRDLSLKNPAELENRISMTERDDASAQIPILGERQ